MAELEKLTVSDVALRLSALREVDVEPADDEVDEARWAYREAAALLSFFDAGSLRPSHGKASETTLRDLVVWDCERVTTSAGQRWRLDSTVRNQALRRLGQPQRMLDAVAAVARDPLDLGRTMAEAYLAGSAPPVAVQTVDQLHGSLLAIEWLSPLSIDMPSADSVGGRVAMASLVQPLRTLVGDHFVGRQSELDRLTRYVGVPPAGSIRRGAWRLASVFRLSEKPPLVIHGPGGMGKSTLVARFVLEQADLGPDRRFPFAYLSFDRADLAPQQPLTLLAEAIRQLGAIYPWAALEALDLEAAVRATLTSRSAAELERRRAARSPAVMMSQAGSDEVDILSRFGDLVRRVIGSAEPLLWVLDSFEQAQRHGQHAVDRLWAFLDNLQSVFPRLRVVFAGRAPIDGKVTEELPLQGFDKKLAIAFLRDQLQDLPVSDKFLRSVARQVDANPLSLKLAAELVRREGAEGLNDQAIFKLSAEEVQGVLYRRILDHLDDPDLRRIANPGLVVRRVTAGVIAEVLAVPCGLGLVGRDRAGELLVLLRREASLVEYADPDTLVHRADVRREMLPLLRRDHPDIVRSIHRRAIAYYRGLDGTQARAEELYHRLALGQSAATIDKHWDIVAGATLERALDELPAAGRVYLAERLGVPVDPDALAEADDTTWARQTARTARELLDVGQPLEALGLVRGRSSHTARLPLLALEAEALATAGQMNDALGAAERGMALTTEEGLSSTYVELALLGARIAEDAGQFDAALDLAARAGSVARTTGDQIGALSADCAQLRLYRRSTAGDPVAAERLREQVIEESQGLRRAEWSRNPSLLRDVAAEIGDALPELVLDATRVAGIDIEGDAGRILDELLPSDQISSFASFSRDVVAPSGAAQSERPSVRESLSGQTIAEQGRQLSDFLRQDDTPSPAWNDALVQAYRDEVDKPTFLTSPRPAGGR
jgi:cellulose synthase operon protein C